MIHPHTQLARINDEIGYGVVATEFIPKGTVTYVCDALEKILDEKEFEHLADSLKQQVLKYSYTDPNNRRILSWDIAKYVNHCCHCNTMSTGWGFEIALRDIHPGEEITDEYGLFIGDEVLLLHCSREHCRGVVQNSDIEEFAEVWDSRIQDALSHFQNVDQPLLPLLDRRLQIDLFSYLEGSGSYRSVTSLKRNPQIRPQV